MNINECLFISYSSNVVNLNRFSLLEIFDRIIISINKTYLDIRVNSWSVSCNWEKISNLLIWQSRIIRVNILPRHVPGHNYNQCCHWSSQSVTISESLVRGTSYHREHSRRLNRGPGTFDLFKIRIFILPLLDCLGSSSSNSSLNSTD